MRYELSDYEWTAIKPMLPNKPRAVRRVNDRRVLSGIFWLLRSGLHGATCPRLMVPAPLVTIEARKGSPQLGNPFHCFDGGMEFDDLIPLSSRLREFAVLVLPPVLGSLVIGAALLWIAAGFKHREPTR
jgi:transposase